MVTHLNTHLLHLGCVMVVYHLQNDNEDTPPTPQPTPTPTAAAAANEQTNKQTNKQTMM
jgi:hypothetical protein